jgi:hypothetical protein
MEDIFKTLGSICAPTENPYHALGRMDSKINHAIDDLTKLALTTDDPRIKGWLYRTIEDLKHN